MISLISVALIVQSILSGGTPSLATMTIAIGTIMGVVLMLIVVPPFLSIADGLI